MKRDVPIALNDSQVRVYRNLNTGCLSIMQNGIVQGHAMSVMLNNVTFLVMEAGRLKAAQSGVKNVHAFAVGTFIESSDKPWLTQFDGKEVVYGQAKRGAFFTVKDEEVISVKRLVVVAFSKKTSRMYGWGLKLKKG